MEMSTAFILTHESDPGRRQMSMSLIALALTRSLGRQGVTVVRIHPNRLDRSLFSRYCARVEISPDFYRSETDLLDFLLIMAGRHPGRRVLIPASDDCAWFVAKYRDALSLVFDVMAPGRAVMEEILDKKRQYERARSLGIPIPETYFPSDPDDLKRLAPHLRNYPYVIKPLVAHTWRRAEMAAVSQGCKGFAVGDADELIRRYETVAQGDRNVMVQEVIGGADERLFTFLSYFDARSRPVACCIRKKIRQLPVDFGYCTMTVSCHDPTVHEQSVRLLQGLGYHGLSGVEWKLDPASGLYKLIEVNPRAVNTLAIAPASGVDLPHIAFRSMLGAVDEPVATWQDDVKWINFEQDFWAARELHLRGELAWSDWRRSLAGRKVDAIYAADDIRPFAGYYFNRMKELAVRAWQRKPPPPPRPPDAVVVDARPDRLAEVPARPVRATE